MKISVIIPAYKPKDYLWECLGSLAAQTFAKVDFEVILVLNGCDDPYKSQIEKYIDEHKGDMDLKFLHTLQGGVSNARNMALECAKGRFICFIDDDDYVSETYLERLYEKAGEDTIVISDTYYFEDGKAEAQIPNRMTELFGMMSPDGKACYMKGRRFLFNGCMKLIPSGMISGRKFDTSFSIGEDCLFMFMISDRLKHVDFTSEDAIYYRRVRPDSALHSHTGKWKIFLNDMKLVAGYTRIYLGGLRRYSFHFFLTRIRGALHLI
jgi:glycosyltransferase involved in cell wall biosynthesis